MISAAVKGCFDPRSRSIVLLTGEEPLLLLRAIPAFVRLPRFSLHAFHLVFNVPSRPGNLVALFI